MIAQFQRAISDLNFYIIDSPGIWVATVEVRARMRHYFGYMWTDPSGIRVHSVVDSLHLTATNAIRTRHHDPQIAIRFTQALIDEARCVWRDHMAYSPTGLVSAWIREIAIPPRGPHAAVVDVIWDIAMENVTLALTPDDDRFLFRFIEGLYYETLSPPETILDDIPAEYRDTLDHLEDVMRVTGWTTASFIDLIRDHVDTIRRRRFDIKGRFAVRSHWGHLVGLCDPPYCFPIGIEAACHRESVLEEARRHTPLIPDLRRIVLDYIV